MTSTQNPISLADVKVGDTIILVGRGWDGDRPMTVAKVTPTQIHLDAVGLRKFNKKDGRKVGERYGSSIRVPAPGELEERERKQAAQAILRRIVAIVDPQTGEERQRNHARLIAGPIENLEQALALLADSIRDEDDNEAR